MGNSTVENLLSQVSAINKKYEKIAEITGENFNIFKILKVETNEVRMHSALLANLLNPNGSHGQKNIFLKLFVKQLSELPQIKNKNSLSEYETIDATMKENHSIKSINNDYTEGGYIDILITNKKGKQIIIENKIYAGDQKNQLIRYHNFDSEAHLFYLTLDGHPPSEWSTKSETQELNEDKIILLSYENNIIEWLEQCKKEATSEPLLRETITQYINLIKYLTHQTMSNEQNKHIKKIISNDFESFQSAEILGNTFNELKSEIHSLLMSEFGNGVEKINNAHFPISWNDAIINFGFYTDDGIYFSFHASKGDRNDICLDENMKPLINFLKNINPNFKNNLWHIGWDPIDRLNNIDLNIYFKLNQPDYRGKFINEILEEGEKYVLAFVNMVNDYKKNFRMDQVSKEAL